MIYNKKYSFYELNFYIWNGIEYDRNKFIKFYNRFKFLKYFRWFSKSYKNEYEILKIIYNTLDENLVKGLLNADEYTVRICFIEKWARIAATDILINKNYSRKTYDVISNLPLLDYKLILKRVEELIDTAQKVATQSNKISDNTPGL